MRKKERKRRFAETEKKLEGLKEQNVEAQEMVLNTEPETRKFTDEELDSLTNDEIRDLIDDLVCLNAFCMELIGFNKELHPEEYKTMIDCMRDEAKEDPELKTALDYFLRIFGADA